MNRKKDQFGLRFYGRNRQAHVALPLHAVEPQHTHVKIGKVGGWLTLTPTDKRQGAHVLHRHTGYYSATLPLEIVRQLTVEAGSHPKDAVGSGGTWKFKI